jgi:enoyl-CoA hydratase
MRPARIRCYQARFHDYALKFGRRDVLGDAALRLAERVAKNAPLAVAASKDLMKAAQGLIEDEFWAMQEHWRAVVFNSGDAREGRRAFADKRPPQWSGT